MSLEDPFEELNFDEIYMNDVRDYLHEMETRMELENIVPGCKCDLCSNLQLLFVSVHITTTYAKKTLFSDKTLDMLAVAVKKNPKYFPILYEKLQQVNGKPKFTDDIWCLIKGIGNSAHLST